MADYIPDIEALLPQGPPFVMVDELLAADVSGASTRYRVTADNPMVDNGEFGAGGLIENIAQTAAAGAGFVARAAGGKVSSGAIVSVSNLEIARFAAVGEELVTAVTITGRVADIIVISGTITCGQDLIARGEMKILTGV
jgi:predicted hotdog family 3-hydroxylacyl-ACP dehydratase